MALQLEAVDTHLGTVDGRSRQRIDAQRAQLFRGRLVHDLVDDQRPVQREGSGFAGLRFIRRHDGHIAEFPQHLREDLESLGPETVIIDDQYFFRIIHGMFKCFFKLQI